MPKVVGVRFRTSPQIYWFSPTDGVECIKGARVVVETQRGVELATVVEPEHEVEESKVVQPLKPIVRLATETELEAARADESKKPEILAEARARVSAHELDMKIVDCEFTVDHSKLVLYFTAEQRVDFRDLVRDLASTFHIRIDLRQIGARDECKLIGSLGPCGEVCCCKRFGSDSEHVSIKMAKNQGLALTPNKINGMCGRLLCCLSYENKTYEDVMRRAPKHGAWVTAPDGRRGTVVSVTPLTEAVRVRFGNDESFEFAEFPMSDLSYEKPSGGDRDGNNGNGGNGGKRSDGGNKKNNDGQKNNGGRGRNGGRPDGGKKNGDRQNVGGNKPDNRERGDRDGNNNNGGKPGNNGNAGPNKKKNRDKKFRNKDKRPNDAPQE